MKIVGMDSRNGRRYTPEALRNAVALYEGKPAYCNHPLDPTTGKPVPGRARVVEDALGKWKNVTAKPDGLYADLHYLKSHPMAERVCEAAERMPDVFGCSHNAMGEGEHKSGVFEITSIPEVRSVDIVCDPGTTNGLFEQKVSTMKTWKQVLESLTALHASKRKILAKLTEDDMMPADAPMPADMPESPSAEDALRNGFWAAIEAVWNDDSLDVAAKVKKIGDLIKTHGKLTETPAEEPAPEMDDEAKPDDSQKTPEQFARENANLKAELSARSLCEQHDMKATDLLVKALAGLPSDDDRKNYLLEAKAMSKVKTPQSRGPGGAAPQNDPPRPTDAKSFAARILG